MLATLLQSDGDTDVDEFWEDVSTNRAAKPLRLLFVTDFIPDPLTRVLEFLNAQMPYIDVLAVEIKRFHGTLAQTLVPWVIGRTAARTRGSGRSDKEGVHSDQRAGIGHSDVAFVELRHDRASQRGRLSGEYDLRTFRDLRCVLEPSMPGKHTAGKSNLVRTKATFAGTPFVNLGSKLIIR